MEGTLGATSDERWARGRAGRDGRKRPERLERRVRQAVAAEGRATGRIVSSERLGRTVRQAVPAKREGPYAVRADAPTRRERDSLGPRRLRRLSLAASVRIRADPQLT